MDRVRGLLAAVDDFQQRHRWLAFPFAVVKKFGDDQAGRHAALLAYYGFFSLFPLLLVAVTVIGFILQGRSDLADRIVDSTAAQFPIVGRDVARTVEGSHLRGSGLALAVGAAFALWGGLGVADAAQAAMNGIWNVPRRRYPNFFLRRLRGLAWLVVLGGGLLAASLAAGFAHAAGGAWSGVAGVAASAVVNTCLFLVGFRVLTVRNVSLRSLLPGAVLAALPCCSGWAAGMSTPAHPCDQHLRHLRPGHRAVVLAVPGGHGDPVRRRARRRPGPPPLAPQPRPRHPSAPPTSRSWRTWSNRRNAAPSNGSRSASTPTPTPTATATRTARAARIARNPSPGCRAPDREGSRNPQPRVRGPQPGG